jgi:hypothetical protein
MDLLIGPVIGARSLANWADAASVQPSITLRMWRYRFSEIKGTLELGLPLIVARYSIKSLVMLAHLSNPNTSSHII